MENKNMMFTNFVNRLNKLTVLNNYEVSCVAVENGVKFTTLNGSEIWTYTKIDCMPVGWFLKLAELEFEKLVMGVKAAEYWDKKREEAMDRLYRQSEEGVRGI